MLHQTHIPESPADQTRRLYAEARVELAKARAAGKLPMTEEYDRGWLDTWVGMSRVGEAQRQWRETRAARMTEIGDSGEADVRAISGHATLEVTRIYNKANAEKARRIAARRREHVAMLAEEREAA